MKEKATPLLDEHLQSLNHMQEGGTDDFFYTRLKARMEKEKAPVGFNFPLKPVWIVATLMLLLLVNGLMLTQQFKTKKSTDTASSSLQNFAASYDQNISSSY